jgi:hypothetical protein
MKKGKICVAACPKVVLKKILMFVEEDVQQQTKN